ncbi:transglutaminase domain-containing protein [Paenibacillus dakarensis]|uniref:transglutaminase domain-containing protein n=1 Tax=Paenibacillus dakarensis TaxID=1527293 RepID=UPI0006D58942|nr:transglutaminase domain-containing protein [Paenibacillus dakarensis]
MEMKSQAFSLNAKTREQIDKKFEQKRKLAQAREQELFGIFHEQLTDEELWALKYLYAYMPVTDLADYDGKMFLSHVRRTLEIRRQMPWGSRVPDQLFLHFVMPYRVNTENIEDSRGILHQELADRTSRLTMKEAILETNYWCHEKATYIASDLRTISPLTMIRNARGRCGEESTLAVAALRSIGIPARQVYTPRWAHCDDNHAWVEAWADGRWYYIGACEPETRLNQGWFSPPARRAMLINTRIFADYPGPEDITLSDEWFTEINLLENYAPTRIIDVSVKDTGGNPVGGAEVHFQLYNMAELYPIASLPTNEKGQASFKTGFGDVLIRAVKDGVWGEIKHSAKDGGRCELVLSQSEQLQGLTDLDMVPPPEREGEAEKALTDEQVQRHNRRLEEGTSIRTSYEGTFIGESEARELAKELKLPGERVWDVLRKARGNSREIAAFLTERSGEYGEWPLRLLETLNEKDLIDSFRPALDDHLIEGLAWKDDYDDKTFADYILCPRVLYEMIVPYRRYFHEAFAEQEVQTFQADPAKLVEALEQDYVYWEDLPNLKGKGNPAGTFSLKAGDEVSLDILFVAVCRSVGIPARLHPNEQKPQYLQNNVWVDAEFHDRKVDQKPHASSVTGRLILRKDPDAYPGAPEASYYENFTIARLEQGMYKTLVFPYNMKDVYDKPFEVEPGAYRIITGVRLKDGTASVRFTQVVVSAGEEIETVLTFRETETEIPVLGQLGEGSRFTRLDGSPVELAELAGTRGAIMAWLEPEREPTKHLLRELGELSGPLAELGAPIVLVIGDAEWTASFKPEQYPELPSNVVWAKDSTYGSLPGFVSESPARESGFPHVFVTDSQNRIRYTASGYRIGNGKEALKIMSAVYSTS